VKPRHCILPVFALLGVLLASPKAAASEEDQETLNQSLRQEAMAGVIPRIEQLIRRGADINSKAPHGETALEYAIRFGRYGAAFRLISLGADPNTEDDSGLSPLLRAASDCNGSRVMEALLRSGADVNHHDLYGRTALINATHGDCARAVAVLLLKAKDNIDLDARDDSLQSAEDLARDGLVPEMIEIARKYRQAHSNGQLTILKNMAR